MKKEERELLAKEKLVSMMEFERKLYGKGIQHVAGVDEVGRGPLAGPVVAAAVILPHDFNVLYVDDSKKLSEKKREELYDKIIDGAVSYSIGIADNLIIDQINILEATKMAMKSAIEGLDPKPEHLLVDGMTLKTLTIPETGIIKGDSLSTSIAAASIIAKVTRDRMMREYHEKFPYYDFHSNKGYGTKAHYHGISVHGLCSLHRRSFLKGYV